LYDINPVGVGSMLLSIVVSTSAFFGVFGALPQTLSPFIGFGVAMVAAPLIAWATDGRYYLARPPTGLPEGLNEIRCVICENTFERPDLAYCPAYQGPICSLCCTLEARCHDVCKNESRFGQQIAVLLTRLLPGRLASSIHVRSVGHFLGMLFLFTIAIACLLSFIYFQYGARQPHSLEVIRTTLWIVFLALFIFSGVACWLLVLAHATRNAALGESSRQTAMLMDEIAAHERTDAALQKAKEVAEAANEAKSRYVVGISHEIRSPLNSIFGYAQLLEREPAHPPPNAVRVIRRSAEHLSNLVDGLLDISKIESGLLRLNRDKVRLGEFLDQLVDMFRVQAVAKGIEFRYEPAAWLPAVVHIDEKRLRQVLINLLSNAIKFTDRGYASLSVRYRSHVAEFEITDSGIGIRPQDMEDIFKPFERGGMPGAKGAPGAGLGLTITKVLVQIMGGEISVQSTPGEGSRFLVRLLLSEARDATSTETSAAIIGYRGARKRILLVDDDPEHLGLLRHLLAPLDFELFQASDGISAVEMAKQCQPDLVTLDIAMPGADGWQVATQLRALMPSLRIIMVSANAHDHRPGADGNDSPAPHNAFVTKPVDVDFLLQRLRELLNIEWIHAEVPALIEAPPPAPAPTSLHKHLAGLRQLGRMGHVRGIEAKLREIEQEDAATMPHLAPLRKLASSFDLKGYLAALDNLDNVAHE
ncbi:MAG: response regulator, partial [Rhizobium sp.]